jgi:glycosyltransferase involved in cell wall biosynthesis
MTGNYDAQVAVITRTKNRPLMLTRARESVARQSFRDLQWVVVNDGGKKTYVDNEVRSANENHITAYAIHNAISVGMEAASNIGIESCKSQYLIIHDDDDTWEPDFLKITVSFLEENSQYLGVVTRSNKVVEEVHGSSIKLVSISELTPFLDSVTLAEMAVRNMFPPISFLFRREAFQGIQGFDETLPVLGDWDFNLRLLLKGDIGVIREPLANHHHRYVLENCSQEYGNTVTTGVDQHIAYEAIYRNRKLRDDLQRDSQGLGLLLSYGKQTLLNHMHLEKLDTLDVEKLMIGARFWDLVRRLAIKLRLIPLFKYFSERKKGE